MVRLMLTRPGGENYYFNSSWQKKILKEICEYLKVPESENMNKLKILTEKLLDSEKEDGGEWMTGCLLALAAQRDSIEAFQTVSSVRKPGSAIWMLVSGKISGKEWQVFPAEEARELEALFRKNSPFWTRKYPFLEQLFYWEDERAALPLKRSVMVKGKVHQSDAPDFWLAVLAGETEIVKKMWEPVGRKTAEYRMELAAPGRAVFREGFQGLFNAACMPGKTAATDYMREGGYCFDEWYFHDLFTAAVLSGNRDMVELMAELLPEIHWNKGMEEAVAGADETLTGWLLERFPEIIRYMRLSAVWRWENGILLKAWSQRGEELDDGTEELKCYLRWREDVNSQWENKVLMEDDQSPADWRKRELFFRTAAAWERAEKIENQLGTEILRKLSCGKLDRKEAMPEGKEALIDILYQMYGEKKIDCTEWITDAELRSNLFGLAKWRGRIAKVDVYRLQVLDRELMMWGAKELYRWMYSVQPGILQGKTDCFTRAVLQINSWDLLKKAIRMEYVGPENALALYEFALTLPRCSPEILQELIFLSGEKE